MTSFSLVIFDCDGVLVDSESIAARTLSRLLTRLGWAITAPEVTERFKGKSLADTVRLVEEHLGPSLPATWLYDLAMFTALDFAKDLRPIPGVRELLLNLQSQSRPFCLASQSTPERIELSLRLADLFSFFPNRFFSATQVERGKPFPDLYLLAAQVMKTRPADCLVIEDSPTGVVAGVNAGMTVWGYAGPGGGNAEALAAAGAKVFTSMHDLAIP